MRRLTNWISRRLGESAGEAADDSTLGLAVAALLVEVLRADHVVGVEERRAVVESLRVQLGLEAGDAEELFREAERSVEDSHDLFQFTSQVNRACSEGEKLRLVEQLWRVAGADASIHKYEEHLVRRIADLLHVSHRDFIAAKLRATGPRD